MNNNNEPIKFNGLLGDELDNNQPTAQENLANNQGLNNLTNNQGLQNLNSNESLNNIPKIEDKIKENNNVTPTPQVSTPTSNDSNYGHNFDYNTGAPLNNTKQYGSNFDPNTGAPIDTTAYSGYKSSNKKSNGILPIIFIILGVVVAMYFSNYSNDASPKYNDDGTPTYISDYNYDSLWDDADQYKGYFIDLVGEVVTTVNDNNNKYVQIYCDPDYFEKNTIVLYNTDDDYDAFEYIKVTGYINGNTSYKAVSGKILTAPLITATKIERTSSYEADYPTIKSVVYTDKSITKNNITVAITKVDFAQKQTRVYLTIKNDNEDTFEIGKDESYIKQNGIEYDNKDVTLINFDKLDSRVYNGDTITGVLTYPNIESYTFNYDIKLYQITIDDAIDFNFDLEVK